MKFVSDRRSQKPNNTKSVLSIKTLMTGKHTVTVTGPSFLVNPNTTTSKLTTQVLVNEGPSIKENSLEFTALDPTESPSFTSISSSAVDSLGALGQADTYSDFHSDDDFEDPYLAPHNNNSSTRVRRSTKETTRGSSPLVVSLSHDDEVTRSNDMNSGALHESSSPLSNPVITFPTVSCDQAADETSQSLSNDSNSPEEPKPTTKLSSLGAFDFPIEAETELPIKPPAVSVSKSLGSGFFDLPDSEGQVALFDNNNKEPQHKKQEGFSLSSPLSAIGKGLAKTLGTITLPRVLQFDLLLTSTTRQQPSATPVSQAVESAVEDLTITTMTRHHIKAEQDCQYWNEIVTRLIQTHGKQHVKTAEGLIQLGHAYMLASEYAQAVVTFQSACRIWNRLERTKDDRLAFARVVDAIGMAWARVSHEDDRDHCHKAMTALEEAFQIRYELLGPWAIDTVETLNKIASVHLHLREYSEACNAYWEVFWTRRAIFGADHPSVAVAAHALGNVFVKLAATKDAANFFQIAVDIYDRMNLPNKHPAVTRLMRDYKRLDRINLTRRIPKYEQARHR